MAGPGIVQSALTQYSAYSVPGIVALLILREVFGFLRNRNGSGKASISDLLATQTEILKRMDKRQEEQGQCLARIETRQQA